MIKSIKSLLLALVLIVPTVLQSQIVNPIAEQAYQGYLNAFLVRLNGQTYLVDGIAKRDRAYFWGQAFMITSLIDAYEENHSDSRKQLINDLLNTFLINETEDWSWNSWSDDIAWSCIALSRGYEITGNVKYKDVAVKNWKFCFERGWDNILGGGVWENMDKHTKASLSNNPMIISGMSLYKTTGDVYFLNNCKRIYEWFRNSGIYNTTTGVVNEAKVNDGTIQYSDHPYNTGSFINAAATLYKYTNVATYLNDAQRAADHVVGNFPILTEEGDGAVRAIAKLAHENGLEWKYYPWLLTQSENAWKNRRIDYNITNNNFTTPTLAGEQFGMQCITAVTVQMVTPIVQSITDKIEAENYNYMNGVSIENITAGGKSAHFSKAGDWLEYVINVTTAGIYNISYSVAGIGVNTLLVQQDGATIDTVFLAGTADNQTYTTVKSSVKLKAGIRLIRLMAVSEGWNIDNWVVKSSPAITPSISVNGGTAQQIAFATVSVGDNITVSPGPADGTWSWTGPGNYTSNSREITISNIQLAQGGIYSATYNSPDGGISVQNFMLTLSGCTATPIIPYIQINDGTLQEINSVTINAGKDLAIVPQAANGTWSWVGPNGFTSDAKTVSFKAIGYKQEGEYIATYYTTNGCKSTKTFTIALTGTEPCGSPITPYLNAGTGWNSVNYATLNVGGTVEFGPQASSDNSWNWTGPNGFTATSRDFSITNFNASKAGYYTATLINASGCKSIKKFSLGLNGCTANSIVPNITLNDTPWEKTDSVTSISGGNISIELPVNNSDGLLTWTGPSGYSSDSSKITINNVLNWQEGKYKFTYLNSQGCVSTKLIEVIVMGDDYCGTTITPKISLNGGTTWLPVSSVNIAAGASIKIGPTGADKTWNWTGPASYTATTSIITLTGIKASQFGVYSAKLTNNLGCLSFQNFNIIQCPAKISPFIQVNNGSLQSIISDTVTVGDTVTIKPIATGATSWKWTYPEGVNLNSKDITLNDIQIVNAGKYKVVNTTPVGCKSDSLIFTIIVKEATSIKETFGSAIKCFPNPATDQITLMNIKAGTTITMYDINGNPILKTKAFNEQRTDIDISWLKPGVYNIKVGNQSIKLIKL